MKTLVKIFFLSILLVPVFKESNAQTQSDDFTTIMVDGEVTSSKLADMDASNILIIEKSSSPMEVGSSRKNIIVNVITRRFAVNQYQEKLKGFSKEYGAYLDGSKGNNNDLMYVLNGVYLEQRDSLSKKLYQIPRKAIRAVSYLGKEQGKMFLRKSMVVVTTKKTN